MALHNLNKNLQDVALVSLQANLLFSTLSVDALQALSANITLEKLAIDEVLFQRGDAAIHIFLLESGQLKLSRNSQSGREKIIEFISPGESFAEAIMFSEIAEYPVTATALAPTQVWCISSKHYRALLKDSPDACFAVMGEMSRRLHAQLAEIDNLSLHTATLRLVTFLLKELDGSVGTVPILPLKYSNIVLASRLSISPETVSRIFAQLTRDGLLEIEGRQLKITNIEALQKILHQA